MDRYLYIIGLIVVLIYILVGFDDFIWDIIVLCKSLFKKIKHDEVDLNAVFDENVKLRAVMIAAWQESNVIEDVISHFINTTIYPTSLFHIFVGVYPNDLETIQAVKRLEAKFDNVHCIINYKPGPTTKAQNLNYVVKEIIKFEKSKGWKFQSFTVHDSEDVISPYELRLSNYYLTKHDGIQFPVFPLIEYPTLKNFFKNITSNTYADEFAENHYLTMYYRDLTKSFVPSAGTGFVLNRDIIFESKNLDFLPQNSLTEDYQLALELYVKNKDFKYLLDTIPIVDDNFKIKQMYVATRSMFPNTFRQAVRQKKRWITGITMQSINMRSIFKIKNISFMGKYSLYRDQKAKFKNLIAFIGYPILIYYILSLFINLPIIYPKYSLSWWLGLIVTIMMFERLAFRMISMYKVYGLKSAFYSSLFPPILSFRYIWGNVINFCATFLAFFDKFKKDKNNQKNKVKKVKWDKTEHTFLNQLTLRRFYIRMGDILIKRNYLNEKDLVKVLKDIEDSKDSRYIGNYLLDKNYINEDQLLESLADINDTVYLKDKDLLKYVDRSTLLKHKQFLMEKKAVIILENKEDLVLAITYQISLEKRNKIKAYFNDKNVYFVFVKKVNLENNLKLLDLDKVKIDDELIQYYQLNNINWQQFILAWDYSYTHQVYHAKSLSVLGLFTY